MISNCLRVLALAGPIGVFACGSADSASENSGGDDAGFDAFGGASGGGAAPAAGGRAPAGGGSNAAMGGRQPEGDAQSPPAESGTPDGDVFVDSSMGFADSSAEAMSPDSGTSACERLSEIGGVRLSICDRFSPNQRRDLPGVVSLGYSAPLLADCHVRRVFSVARDHWFDFANNLSQFNIHLWGCEEFGAVSFDLVDQELIPTLSEDDVAALVDVYVTLARRELSLSNAEASEMRVALECLAEPVLDRALVGLTISECRTPDAGTDSEPPLDGSAEGDGASEASGDASVDGGARQADAGAELDASPSDANGSVDG